MALPRAFATLGIVLGMGSLAGVFVLSLFSLNALVRCTRGWREGWGGRRRCVRGERGDQQLHAAPPARLYAAASARRLKTPVRTHSEGRCPAT